MNLSHSHLAQQFALLVGALVVMAPLHGLPADVTITNFGYQHIKVGVSGSEKLSLGPRPLVVIMLNFQGGVALTNTVAFYDGLLFTNAQNVNSFHREISNGRFWWTREGYVPFSLSSLERRTNIAPSVIATNQELRELRDLLYQSNIVAKLMLSNVFNFRSYDSNSDSVIADDELEIAIFHDDDALGHRPFGRVQPPDLPGAPYSVDGRLTTIPQAPWGFYTIAHELSHGFGLTDLYGPGCQCLSQNMTIMAANTASEDETFHLDPAYKMQLGWSEPSVMDMGQGGILDLPAAQLTNPTAPVILYANDANHSTNQFFMIEYRTTNTSMGPGYDRTVASSGLVIWQITLDPNRDITGVPSSTVTNNNDPADYTLGAPNLSRGGNQAWRGPTPNLAWWDGTPTTTHLKVWPFAQDSDSITVEVLTARDTWVDFNYVGTETGSSNAPYRTLGKGVTNAAWGGILNFKPGSSSETQTIVKPLTFKAPLGTVTIGQ